MNQFKSAKYFYLRAESEIVSTIDQSKFSGVDKQFFSLIGAVLNEKELKSRFLISNQQYLQFPEDNIQIFLPNLYMKMNSKLEIVLEQSSIHCRMVFTSEEKTK